MTGKKDQLETPSIKEAIVIADILDEAGFYKDASLIDDFIEEATQYEDDLVKQAGIFSGIWNRLSGLAKRMFFKEYRQMYAMAKEAHAAIGERMDEAYSLYKEATKDFKNYELVAWREKVLQLPVHTKDLMVEYEKAFGRLVAFTYKLQDQGQVSRSKQPGQVDIKDITPPGEGGEGAKPPGEPTGATPTEAPISRKELNPDTRFMKEKGWSQDPLVPSIATNALNDEIAIERARFSRYLRTHIVDASTDPEQDWYKLGPHKRKMPQGLREAMGDRTWQVTSMDSDWVYLSPVGGREEAVPPDEEVPGEPTLPKPGEEEPTLPKPGEEEPAERTTKTEQAKEIAQQLVDMKLVAPEAYTHIIDNLLDVDETEFEKYRQKIEQVKDLEAPEEETPTPEEETPTPEPEITEEEEREAERTPVSREDLEKIQQLKEKYKDKVWAVYTTIKGKQRCKLVNPEELSPRLQQVSGELEDALFEALYLKRYKQPRARVVEYPESRAELVNRFLFHRG